MTTAPALSNPSDSPLILIVDDQIDNIQVLALFLETHGYSVTYALSGKEALDRLKAIQPDLMLLDLFMPGMNGLEVCEQVKSQSELMDLPILFLTASHDEDHITSAFEKGAADYVMKPFKPKEILARAATHIKLRQQTVELKRINTQLDTIVTHVKDGLLVVDDAGTIQFVNPAAAHMFQKQKDQLLGHSLGLPVTHQHSTCIEILRLNGEVGLAEITVAEARWDIQPAWIVCLRDISDRR